MIANHSTRKYSIALPLAAFTIVALVGMTGAQTFTELQPAQEPSLNFDFEPEKQVQGQTNLSLELTPKPANDYDRTVQTNYETVSAGHNRTAKLIDDLLIQEYAKTLVKLKVEEVAAMSYGNNHPLRSKLRKQIKMVETELEKLSEDGVFQARNRVHQNFLLNSPPTRQVTIPIYNDTDDGYGFELV